MLVVSIVTLIEESAGFAASYSNEPSKSLKRLGEGNDPWGGYRAGFSGATVLKLSDYGIDYNLGPASSTVEIELHVEGKRQ